VSIFSWNCQGIGQSRTVQELSALVRAKSPSMVFLMEMCRSAVCATNLRWRLGLKHAVGADSLGQSGGLMLFWHENVEVVVLGLSSQFIDACVKDAASNLWYRVTFVYGVPSVENRHHMWETL
jgi:hypothetical protein